MKKQYSFVVAFLVFVLVIIHSCNENNRRIAENLYKEREFLLKEFKDISVISRGGKLYQLSYYKGQYVNTFYFEKKDGILIFINDTLQYPLNEINAFTSISISDSLNYRKVLSDELSRLLRIMDDFKIGHVSAEDRLAGIDMKIYFGDYEALLYVSNVSGIKNERWKNYVVLGKRLGDSWYHVKEE